MIVTQPPRGPADERFAALDSSAVHPVLELLLDVATGGIAGKVTSAAMKHLNPKHAELAVAGVRDFTDDDVKSAVGDPGAGGARSPTRAGGRPYPERGAARCILRGEHERPVTMDHLWRAAVLEYEATGKLAPAA